MDGLKRALCIGLINFLFMCVLAFAASAEPAGVDVSTRLDKETAGIGEPIRFTVEVVTKKGVTVRLPEAGEMLGTFTVKDVQEKEGSFFGTKTIQREYVLQAFDVGDAPIPPLVIAYTPEGRDDWQEIATDEQPVSITSLLTDAGEELTLRDIKGPVSLGSARIVWWLLLMVLLITGAVAFVLWKRKHQEAAPVVEQGMPAHEIALVELEALRRKELIKAGKIEEYFVEVSGIVRRYLERRFDLHAPEMTTEEFLISVREDAALTREHQVLLKDFLVCCDLVKFAKYAPMEHEITSVFDSAKNFVEQTKEEKGDRQPALGG